MNQTTTIPIEVPIGSGVDLLIGILIIIGAVVGFKRGVIVECISFFAVLVLLTICVNISKSVFKYLTPRSDVPDLFADLTPRPPLLGGEGEVVRNQTSETKAPRLLGEGFGVRSKSVLSVGREIWRYYFTMEDANANASFYDIREYFQGRNNNGKMNANSKDKVYTELMEKLKESLRQLGEEIKTKVYEYGFLM